MLPTASGLPPCLKHSPYLRDFAVQLLVMQIPALLCLAHNPLEIFETVRADKKVGGKRMIIISEWARLKRNESGNNCSSGNCLYSEHEHVTYLEYVVCSVVSGCAAKR